MIRAAMSQDRDAILAVVLAAFSSSRHDGREEVAIVTSTWESGKAAIELELVAIAEDAVVGHVLAGWGDLEGRPVVGVAPLAVAPSFQSVGIGTALMVEFLRRAEGAGLPLVVLLGDPGFYGRLGFQPSAPFGITYSAVGADNPHFQVRLFPGYDPSYRGSFSYCWEVPGPER